MSLVIVVTVDLSAAATGNVFSVEILVRVGEFASGDVGVDDHVGC